MVAEGMRELDRVGLEFRVGAVVGAAPVEAVRGDAVGDGQQRHQRRVLGISRGRRAGQGGGVAISRSRRRLHVVKRVADVEEDARVARSGNTAHADAVDLDASAEGIGVGGVRAGATDIRSDVVVEVEVTELVGSATNLDRGVETRAAVGERFPADGAGVAVMVAVVALAELFDLRGEGVEADAEAREDGLVDVDGITLRAEIVVADGGGGPALEGGALGRDVDDAGGINIAVGQATGTAGKLDPLRVKGVLREEPRVAVTELADRRDAAEVNLVAGAGADRRADRALIVELILGTDGKVDRTEEVGDREVTHEVGGEDRDGVGQIGELLVGARAGERRRSGVPFVLGGIDLERREHDGRIWDSGGGRGGTLSHEARVRERQTAGKGSKQGVEFHVQEVRESEWMTACPRAAARNGRLITKAPVPHNAPILKTIWAEN